MDNVKKSLIKTVKYKWTLEEDFRLKLNFDDKILGKVRRSIAKKITLFVFSQYESKDGWLEVTSYDIRIKKGYSWDGCTPKYKISGFEFGVWDGFKSKITNKQQLYYASLVHDALCQFQKDTLLPVSRKEADMIFYSLMKKEAFSFRCYYYIVVRIFSMIKNIFKRG